jgi:hypothetical protein
MSKIKKINTKTKANMKIVLDNLEETINRRMKLIEKYNESGDDEKMRIAHALEDNVGALIQMKNDMIAVEKNSEKVIFGD